uniref:Repeat domain-containing protein n=1 Tax=Candidatus Kentrum sp. TUN TaxID=2126343 RepID=A0A450ZIR9_9GAMM|nr:MAG: Repeat domain-containing protein [Candidatus Kentron sp. TUN]VFK56298.1 MAG: Repeat domain-containing protein [Candidatus Kentron sp. TUN]VFK62387.1 MAG: Repeat domain-containing protein [Candidatus Kentron sp. TUN]
MTQNDAIIGKAFRWSLIILSVVLAVVALSIYLFRIGNTPPDPVGVSSVQGPRKQAILTEEPPPSISFVDITEEAGIDFVHVNGAYGDKLLPETMGGGVAIFDYDGDGNQDLLFVNSNHWEGYRPESEKPVMALYRNDGTGRFMDITVDAGLAVSFYGMGVAVGDYDNDGWVDVFFTAVGANRLFRNEEGRFRDVTNIAGVAGDPHEWSTSSAFFDYDNDGDLDLFVGNYVNWSREIDLAIGFQLTGIGRAYGPPTTFAGSYPYLYRNDGDGTFTDVSAESGIQVDNPATGRPMAKTLGLSPMDADGDGFPDIFLANDTVRNFLFHNQGDGTFREEGITFGVAFDRNGAATGAMGSDVAYYRNDGDLGLAVGNFANEMTSLYVSQDNSAQFTDEAIGEGLGSGSRLALTFGLFFFDYDLDGRPDLLQANGHLEKGINLVQSSQHYAQLPQLFWNCAPNAQTAFCQAPPYDDQDGFAKQLVGRGAAFGDIDNDGDPDIVITQIGRRPMLLRNDQTLGNHWLRFKLIGKGGVNRDAIGAWVEVTTGNITQRRQVMPTKSYLSQIELPLTFGLGNAENIDRTRILWPDGTSQEIEGIKINSFISVEKR